MRKMFLSRPFLSILFVLALITSTVVSTFQTSSSSADTEVSSHVDHDDDDDDDAKPTAMKIKNVKLDSPTLTLIDSVKGEEGDMQLAPGAEVELNGEDAKLDDLLPDDQIYVERNEHGLITEIEAHRKFSGTIVSTDHDKLVVTPDYVKKLTFVVVNSSMFKENDKTIDRSRFHTGDHVYVTANQAGEVISLELCSNSIISDLFTNFKKNLFKPLLLFFYLGFAITLLHVPFEFPQPLYQGLTMYLLVAIGWHGGEELACLNGSSLAQAAMFMCVGFITNLIVGLLAYAALRIFVPKLRRIDAAAVAGHYGSDSAGTFVTALGVLQVAAIAFAAYMPVMLAVMEIPGCLVALFLAARLRAGGMDAQGYAVQEASWHHPKSIEQNENFSQIATTQLSATEVPAEKPASEARLMTVERVSEPIAVGVANGGSSAASIASTSSIASASSIGSGISNMVGGTSSIASASSSSASTSSSSNDAGSIMNAASAHNPSSAPGEVGHTVVLPEGYSVESGPSRSAVVHRAQPNTASLAWLNPDIMREIFLNPGLFLLIGGISIGYIARLQGPSITAPHDSLFVTLFQGMLCLFLLEMGMTAAKRVRDLKTAGTRFILFGLLAPNFFACFGIAVTSLFSHITGMPFQLGTYVLFAVLCGSSSYIAVPAIQRLAIPEASPTLPLAASLGLTFTYNVTVGIPLYLAISEAVVRTFPVF